MVRQTRNKRMQKGTKGAGTPRFRYDNKKGVYIYKKSGGGLLSTIGKGLSKGVGAVIAKPVTKVLVKKGVEAVMNKNNQKAAIQMATHAVGSKVMERLMRGNPEIKKMAKTELKEATKTATKQLEAGRRVNGNFMKGIIEKSKLV